ncbi:hypothetical protein E5082_32210 [Streptomyces griseoluteus]|uniref:Uncharacterized protein n=1 Tax=Streptomyces griseoluteus TaxID=29306 RepID=A0A4Z1CX06_STRGP|nr:hypothetical protein [Streptomyces griseoluteus]TGN73363.1 hypothetical protein E5082_32210 [Streptomyces griseoluteus]GHE98797.1 hypothetical protein GCM10017776_14800 [Streptomyces griseoluteus]
MRNRTLSKIGTQLLRLRHDTSQSSQDRTAPADYGLDQRQVDEFVAGTLDAEGEAALAHQVARLLPFHWTWPNRVAEAMSQIMNHFDDQRELMAWLDRHPGLPRLVARLYVFMGLLDSYSAMPAVVTAMREYRERTPYPPGLQPYLVPATDDDTLSSIAFKVEKLLGEERTQEAVELALATAAWLQQIAPRARELTPEVGDLDELMGHARQDIQAAAADI